MFYMREENKIYKCPDCGWKGNADQLEFEDDSWDEDVCFSDTVCPNCKRWFTPTEEDCEKILKDREYEKANRLYHVYKCSECNWEGIDPPIIPDNSANGVAYSGVFCFKHVCPNCGGDIKWTGEERKKI